MAVVSPETHARFEARCMTARGGEATVENKAKSRAEAERIIRAGLDALDKPAPAPKGNGKKK